MPITSNDLLLDVLKWGAELTGSEHSINCFYRAFYELESYVKRTECSLVDAANKCAELQVLVEGVPQDAIDGGWTALGLSKYAQKLEIENSELRCKLGEMNKQEPVKVVMK